MTEEAQRLSVRLEDAGRIRDAIGRLLDKGVLGRQDAPKAKRLARLFARRHEVPLESVLAAIWPDEDEPKALNNYRGFKMRLNEHFAREALRVVMCSPQDNSPVAQKKVWFEEELTPEEVAKRKEDEEAARAAAVIEREHRREFEGTPSREYVPQEVTIGLPAVRFPDTLIRFAERFAPDEWKALASEDRNFLSNLCTKLEPIVQIVPQTPVPLVLGFECLALGMNGQSFGEIEARFKNKVSPALLRLLITLAAFESASSLRSETRLAEGANPQQLLFTINLDPEMLASGLLERVLDAWRDRWQTNLLFEVNEATATAHVKRVKQLVADFGLRLCLDDANRLDKGARDALASHAEISKVDHTTFLALMGDREATPEAVVAEIASHRLPDKPLLVEGVEDDNHLRFLRRHWRPGELGPLQGQGYALTPGRPWDGWTADLRDFGLHGGHILASPLLAEANRIVRDFLPAEHRPYLRHEMQGNVFRISAPARAFGRDHDLVLGVLSERAKERLPAREELRDLDFLVVKERLGTLGWQQVVAADLRSHLDAWARAGQVGEKVLHDERERFYEARSYVPPEVTPLKGAEVSSAEEGRHYLLDWVQMDRLRFCAILGDYGVGKTFLCRMWSAQLLELREAGDRSWPVPLYLDMRNLPVWKEERVPRLEEMLEHLLKEAGFRELPAAGVLAAVRRGHVVLIFDGFDEHSVHLTDAQATELMRQIRAAAPPDSQGKVLITCRTHYFLDRVNEREKVRGGGGVRTREGFEAGDFAIAYLQPFDEKRIRTYLEKVLGGGAHEAFEFMKRVHDLVDLGKRPVLLAMIASNLEHLERRARSGERVKAADIYEGVLRDWLERDTGKHVLFPDLKPDLMAELARRLWIAGGRDAVVHYRELRPWLLEQTRDTFRLDNPEAVWRIDADMRTATFLVRDPKGNYRFAHTSFLEFFLARGVALGLSEGRAKALDLPRLNKEAMEFTVDLVHGERGDSRRAGEALCAILQSGYRPLVSENALLLVVAWRRLRAECAPSPSAYHLEGARLGGADLTGASLPGAFLSHADLQGADMRACDLAGADLRGANLAHASARSIILDRADLSRALLEAADLAGGRLREAVLAKASGTDVFLQRTDCERARFDGGILRYARLARSNISPAQREAGHLHESSLPQVSPTRLSLVPQLGHVSAVNGVAFGPDGARIASGSSDHTVKLWEATTGRLLRTLTVHSAPVLSVALSPDGAGLACASGDLTVKLCEVGTGRLLRTLKGHRRIVNSVAFSPDGATLGSGSYDHTVKLWETATGRHLRTLEGHGDAVLCVAFSPDGDRLASGSYDHTVKIWEAATGRLLRTLEGHGHWAMSVAFSPDGATLASGSADNTVKLWQPATGRLLRTLKGHSGSVLSVAFSPDGHAAGLASGSSDHTVKLWDPTTGRLLRTLDGHRWGVISVAFSPNGARLGSASADHTVKLWEAATGRLLRTLQGHGRTFNSVAFSPDGATLASASHDNTVKLWEAATGHLLRTLEGHSSGVRSVAFSPDGATLASASHDHTVKLWEAATGRLLRTLEGHSDAVLSVAFSPDAARLASRDFGGKTIVWDAQTGTRVRKDKRAAEAWGGRSTTSGRLWVSAAPDATIRVSDRDSGKVIVSLMSLGKKQWAVWTPEGFFDAPESAFPLLGLTDGLVSYPVEEFAEHFHRPDIIRERLAKARKGK